MSSSSYVRGYDVDDEGDYGVLRREEDGEDELEDRCNVEPDVCGLSRTVLISKIILNYVYVC